MRWICSPLAQQWEKSIRSSIRSSLRCVPTLDFVSYRQKSWIFKTQINAVCVCSGFKLMLLRRNEIIIILFHSQITIRQSEHRSFCSIIINTIFRWLWSLHRDDSCDKLLYETSSYIFDFMYFSWEKLVSLRTAANTCSLVAFDRS